ncbi:MAG: tRNA lysidine(34) synthetase TilS [bacterium]
MFRNIYEKIEPELVKKLSKKNPVLIAFSGGPDSICLYKVISRHVGKKNCHLLYINHQLRKDHLQEEAFIKTFSKSENVPLTIKRIPIKRHAERYKLSIEASGHLCRKAILKHYAKLKNIQTICMGHHQDDHLETRLLRIIKGCANHFGNLTFQEKQPPNTLLRPLINIEKKEILNYLNKENISYYTDSSNSKDTYDRNKLRLNVIPTLKKINPAILKTLKNIEELVHDQYNYIDQSLKEALEQIHISNQTLRIKIRHFDPLSSLQQKRLLYLCYEKLKKNTYTHTKGLKETLPKLSKSHLENLESFLKKRNNSKQLTLPKGLRAYYENKTLLLTTNTKRDTPYKHPLKTESGVFLIPNHPLHITWKLRKTKTIAKERLKYKKTHLLNLKKLQAKDLYIRSPQQKDTFHAFGKKEKKTLNSFFKKKQIPLSQQKWQPLLCHNNEILCVIGIEIAEPYKIVNLQENALLLRVNHEKNLP